MDFQIGRLAFFIVCLTGLIVFSVYSIRAVRRSGIACYLRGLFIVARWSIVAMSKTVIGLVGFLASSAEDSDTQDVADIAPSGGVLNYRTGKLDDGTDPIGWYEKS